MMNYYGTISDFLISTNKSVPTYFYEHSQKLFWKLNKKIMKFLVTISKTSILAF